MKTIEAVKFQTPTLLLRRGEASQKVPKFLSLNQLVSSISLAFRGN